MSFKIFNKTEKDQINFDVQERDRILSDKSSFFAKEAYNTLIGNITFSITGKNCKIIEVTSSRPREGKSLTTLNIAISFAKNGKNVLLVDCDLRKPKINRLLDMKASPGLSNILIGEKTIEESIVHLEEYGIDVLCSGDIPPSSTQLFEAESMEEFIDEISKKYDFIILDTPPVNTVIDACITARYTNGIVFVVRHDYAKKDDVVNAVKQLEFAGGKVIGFVLNNIMDKNALGFSSYKYKYRYRDKYKNRYYENNGYSDNPQYAYDEYELNEEAENPSNKQGEEKSNGKLI